MRCTLTCVPFLLLILLALPTLTHAQIEWELHLVATWNTPHDVVAADMDQDGDTDVIGVSLAEDAIMGWEQTVDGWVMHPVLTSFNNAQYAYPVDLDQDGDMDLLGTASNSGQVVFLEQTGPWEFTNHVLGTITAAESAHYGDMDGDGDLDVVAVGQQDPHPRWYESLGNGSWAEHQLPNLASVYSVRAGDFDADGDIDIATCSYSSGDVAWLEQIDTGEFVIQYLGIVTGAHCIDAGDADGDGLIDFAVVGFSSGEAAVFHQSSPGVFTQEIVATGLGGAYRVHFGDIDGDSDLDLVSAVSGQSQVVWIEQGAADWTVHTVASGVASTHGAYPADVDSDGDMDVVGAAFSGGDIYWWEQVGTPGPVSFTLNPQNTTIPAGGGTLTYGVELVSTLPNTVPGLLYSTNVELPNGQTFGPLSTIPFTHTPFMTVNIQNIPQAIPALAPSGTYTFIATVGFSQLPLLDDSFDFVKLSNGPAIGGRPVVGWGSGIAHLAAGLAGMGEGEGVGADETATTPATWQMSEAYPNPFNPSTSVSVVLPEAADLTVTVYDRIGREVTELAHGSYSAGAHTLTFDASGLASGVYFIQATVPGQLNAMQKVVLMK